MMAAEFDRRWPPGAEEMDGVQRHALCPPGKLLRPLLTIRAGLAVGGELTQILPAAVGFEAVHVGSLIHDDLIDGDEVRRGRSSVTSAYGPAKAIVTGNALFFGWFGALGECVQLGVPAERVTKAMAVQAEAGSLTCRGVFLELDLAGDLECTVEKYVAMVEGKTAALMAAACRVGAILGGGDVRSIELLGSFGHHLGVAYQIRDDLLPYVTTMRDKPADSDLRNGRPTLPVLLAYHHGDDGDRAEIRHALLSEPDPHLALTTVHGLLTKTGAIADAQTMAESHEQLAHQALEGLAPTPQISHLKRLTRAGGNPAIV